MRLHLRVLNVTTIALLTTLAIDALPNDLAAAAARTTDALPTAHTASLASQSSIAQAGSIL